MRPVPWYQVGTRFGRLDGTIGRGTDSRFPSIEDLFTDADAPGLAQQPDYSYAEVFTVVDYRDQDDNARDGGFYSLTWREYSDLDFNLYSFRAVDLMLQQFVPIFDKKRVFAVQAALQSAAVDEGAGQQVPFYFKPTLGGSTSHRGYNDYRFRDDAVVYVNAEYRWEAFSGLDMALFYDWGSVAPNIDAPEAQRHEARLRHRVQVQHHPDGAVPCRHRVRRRRRTGLLQVQQGVLTPATGTDFTACATELLLPPS